MSDNKKSSESRRKLLKSIAAGSGAVIAGKSLPESWSRPVVDSVMLPAHAQTSITTFTITSTPPNFSQLDGEDSIYAKVLDSLTPEAQARPPSSIVYCVTPTGPDTAHFSAFDGYVLFSATDVPLNTEVTMTGTYPCEADAGDWLDDIGLVNNANASLTQAAVVLSSITLPYATGVFTWIGRFQEGFNAAPGTCPSISCMDY